MMMMMMMVVVVVVQLVVGMRGRAELKGRGVMLRRRMRMVAVPHVFWPERMRPEAEFGGVLARLPGRRGVRVPGEAWEGCHARGGVVVVVARSPRQVY